MEEIAARTRERVAEAKRLCPDPREALSGREILRRRDQVGGVNTFGAFPFEAALKKKGLSFICEVKKASPSKGLIAQDFPYVDIARDYENAGADAISCLTEPFWFQGKNQYLTEIRRAVDIPLLRKDFTVDEYMIREAQAIGAQAILLICAILDPVELKDYRQMADDLGLSAVVEAHGEEEIAMAVRAGARIIGVNNRNLKDFTVDIENAGRLRDLVPEGTLFISESGVKSRADIVAAEEMQADAVLVGETMMRSKDKAKTLMDLSGRPPKVKICGLMTREDVEIVNRLGADYAGFVFANTRHKILHQRAAELKRLLNPDIPAVGVFVDAPKEEVIGLLNEGTIDLAQLHGNETNEEIKQIRRATGKKVIKAVLVRSGEDLKLTYPAADYLLYDAGKGDGKRFDWNLLKRTSGQPFFLAGGLNADNVREGIKTFHPYAVDVSSSVEDEDCSKNEEACQSFIEAVRKPGAK